MSNKFLVALDGSEGGRRAIHVASSFAKATMSDLILTYVIDWTPYSFHTPQELEERHQRRESEIQRANDSVLQPEVSALTDSGVSVETIVRHGRIAETIVDIARENEVSHIFIGRLGESRLHSMIFGSVTAALVQTSLVPVTVVP
ncbi:universal stress protein [Gammaproteobacteria bacterium]|nr:universal stress protein [Gammaproteobacteria bacterium]